MNLLTTQLKLAVKPVDTWQGEYPLLGKPVRIIRFAGCNLGKECPLPCDTAYSWAVANSVHMHVIEVIHDIEDHRALMITGGEPFLHPKELLLLTEAWLRLSDQPLIIETNGTLIFQEDSPKWRSLLDAYPFRVHFSVSPKCHESFDVIPHVDSGMWIGKNAHWTLKVVCGAVPYERWHGFVQRAHKMGFQIVLMPLGSTPGQIRAGLTAVEKFGREINVDYLLSPRAHIFLNID